MPWKEVLTFWFEEIEPAQHWKKDPEFDKLIRDRFAGIHAAATKCELFGWRDRPEGRLAEVIVLDQFSRNLYRDQPASFANDSQALSLAQEAILVGADKELGDKQVGFLYMPFMHSESAIIHQVALRLFEGTGNFDFEVRHNAIIERFKRYPHRNEVLGRDSTPEEIEFLNEPGSSF
ncbi:MAG: hypothetical protein ACI87E_000035 [Mariniblastus sp.]|jgi:uncharacterized protein (DUF924 family)